MIKKNTNGISIIIPNYNSGPFILDCLNSIYQQKGIKYEIILIDDKSHKKYLQILKNEKNKIKLYFNKKNIGYAGSCNAGVAHAKYPLLIFMNSDVILTKKDFLKEVECIFNKDNKLGVLGFYQKNVDGSPQFLGANVDIFLTLDPDSKNPKKIEKKLKKNPNILYDSFMTGGACYAINKDIYRNSGGLDGDYFLYVEELDLMWRLKLMGYKIGTSLRMPIIHLGGGSTGNHYNNTTNANKIYLRERNTMITMIKNYQIGTLIAILPIYLLSTLFESIYLILKLKFKESKAYYRAHKDVILNIKYIWEKRKRVVEKRKISDLDLLGKSIKINYFKIKHILINGIPKIK